MKKNNNILIALIIVIACLLIYLTLYKKSIKKESNYFVPHELEKHRKFDTNIDKSSIYQKYKDNILFDDLLSIDYNFYKNEQSITGKIYIGEDKKLYISDTNNNIVHKVSNINFKTLFKKEYVYDSILIFLISEDLELYSFELKSDDIKESFIVKNKTDNKVLNFVNIDFTSDLYGISSTLFILDEENKLFDITSNLVYDNKIVSLYNKYFVFSDNTLTDVNGYFLEDINSNKYKIKYFFIASEEIYKDNFNRGLIITEDNRLIFLNDLNEIVYEYNKKIKNINYEGNHPYVLSKLSIIFEDDSVLNYSAACSEYFCINKFN